MCTKNCLCNTCYKRNTCSDCPYIDMRDISNNPWSIVCSTTGIQSCDYYIEPPKINLEIEEEKPMIIKFKNSSTIETIDDGKTTIRSEPKEFYYEDISEYINYMKRYPYKIVELCTGIKLHHWQRLYLRLLDSDLVKRLNRNKRR